MANLGDTYSDAYGEDVLAYEASPGNAYSNLGIAGSEQVGSYGGAGIYSGSGGSLSPKSYDEYAMSSPPAGSGVESDQYGSNTYSGSVQSTPSSSPADSFLNSNPGVVSSGGTGVTTAARGSITTSGIKQTGSPLPTPTATVSTKVSNVPMPTFKMPTYDEGAIKKARQKKMGPMTRELRMAVQQALSKSYENPAVRNQAVEAALRGYGVGLEKASAGAEAAAQQEYNMQFAREMQSAQAAFTNAMNAWQGSQISVSTTTPFNVNNQSDLDKIKTMFA